MTYVRFIDKLNRYFTVFVGIAFGIMTLLIFLQIIARLLFTQFNILISIPWTEELARYLMIWSIFVGGAIATRNDRLVSLEFAVHKLPTSVGKAVKIGALIVTLIFFGYLILPSYDLALQGLNQTSPVLRIPMALVYASMPVGAILTIMNIIALFMDTRLNKQDIRHVSSEAKRKEIEEDMIDEDSQRRNRV